MKKMTKVVAGATAGLLCFLVYRQITTQTSGTRPDSQNNISSTRVESIATTKATLEIRASQLVAPSQAAPPDTTGAPPIPVQIASATGSKNQVATADAIESALKGAPEVVRNAVKEQGLPPRALTENDPYIPVYSTGNGQTVTNRAADAGVIYDRNGNKIGSWVQWMPGTTRVTNYGDSISIGNYTVPNKVGGGI